jgi:hypothetical protein
MPLNKAIMNLGSVKSNCNYAQGFQRSFVTGASEDELKYTGESLLTLLKNEAARVFTIDAGNPQAIENEEAKLINECNRRAKFEYNQLADDSRQVQSAESKAKDLIARVGIYNYTLDLLETALEAIYTIHADFEGIRGAEISVSIARDYGLEDEAAEMQELSEVFAQARELGATEVQKAILRTRIRKIKLIPKAEEKQTEEDMYSELDADIESSGVVESQLANFSVANALQQ